MAALWKQETSLHPAFDALNRCLRQDWFLLPYELKLQRAHAKALEAAGILSSSERAAIARGLDEIEARHAGGPCPDSDAEDLHTWIESSLVERIGDAGRKIHAARSRNDQVATLLRMFVIDAGQSLRRELRGLIEAACRRAIEWADLAFPLQTHCQFAAPGTIGYWVLRYATAWRRIFSHLGHFIGSWQAECPLGSGAVAGSSIGIDRRLQATELGFAGPSANALYSTSTRDECIEWLAAAAQLALHLQSFAEDVIAFSQTPFAWAKYPPAFGTGSSMMPNKMNPDAMELLRGACNAILAAHGQALLLIKGLPSGYNRDLQCIKPLMSETVARTMTCCRLTAAFLSELEFDAEAMKSAMRQGHIGATLRMEEMVKAGHSLREAHHAVAAEVQKGAADLAGDPVEWVRRYETLGSANPAETRRVANELLNQLSPRKGD